MKEIRLDFTTPIKKLEISPLWHPAKGIFASKYASVFKGRGLEFAGFREYDELTDDAKLIDWKASLRANKLLVRELVEERNLEIFFLFDVSESMLFSSIEKLKCEYAAEFIAALSYGILSAEDSVGLGFFNDRLRTWISPGRGVQHYAIIKLLLKNTANYGGKYDLSKALRDILALPRMKMVSVLFVVSDFIGANDTLYDLVSKMVNRFKGVFCIMVRDPLDSYLPKGIGYIYLADPNSGELVLVNADKIREKYNREAQKEEKMIEENLKGEGADFMKLHTNKDFVTEFVKFFKRKYRVKVDISSYASILNIFSDRHD